MANWDKITKSSDNSALKDRDFQIPVLNRDVEKRILEPQSDLTMFGLEHNSLKQDITPVCGFEDNYYHSKHHQNMNYHQSTNYQSSRRHSVSNPQTKERPYINKSQNQGINLVGRV